jgi:hypothetical protein
VPGGAGFPISGLRPSVETEQQQIDRAEFVMFPISGLRPSVETVGSALHLCGGPGLVPHQWPEAISGDRGLDHLQRREGLQVPHQWPEAISGDVWPDLPEKGSIDDVPHQWPEAISGDCTSPVSREVTSEFPISGLRPSVETPGIEIPCRAVDLKAVCAQDPCRG